MNLRSRRQCQLVAFCSCPLVLIALAYSFLGIKGTVHYSTFQILSGKGQVSYGNNDSASGIQTPPEEYFVRPRWEKKYFIYDCANGNCGGLGDRQEGIVGAFIISQMLSRKFKVKMLVPCDIGNFLQANKVDWILQSSEISDLKSSAYKRIDADAFKLRDKIAKSLDLEKEFPSDVTHFTVNQEMVNYLKLHPLFKSLRWAHNQTTTDIYNIVLRRLFRMKPEVQKRFDLYQSSARSNGRKLVCAHVRVRGNPTIPNDWYTPTPLNVSVVWNFLRQYNNSALYRMFVATDSQNVRQDAKRLFPDVIQDLEGNIVHVDRDNHAKDYACAGFGKVILDQQTMSSCDVFFMTDSGLGRIASMMRGTDKDLYCMASKSTYRKCSFSDKAFFPQFW
ncbi:uncharacterized protein LOC124111063 [Haliotis rufescens]|uniref:uncharacterized protein LOC124111062 n=1 Tax=Haliotis rufescens TaxID=6454 RepID=UPI00201F1F53|nr:uncharacterized protein LOC124111062 [Haliotis rufescens]XP_048247429.1 uncharacterized protein LOC124111063 [Haliotis rufescens]XP_048247430.1 uncharacterized protein LOC124111063 [Haliotis rufescens]